MSNHYQLRRNYEGAILHRRDLDPNPHLQFDAWFDAAIKENVPEPNAMVLSTVNAAHRPSSRFLLLKEHDEKGFIFFTNYRSHKACDLAVNNQACLLFWWQPMRRQVRITGRVEKVPPEISDDYFAVREKASNISALASPQSFPVKDREELQKRCEEVTRQFEGVANIPRPEYWGGYRLIPEEFEFWQGALNRLHDRFLYRKKADAWVIERLAP